jgi:hypothetical protein
VIIISVFDVCFFMQALALSKSMVAKRASEASQQSCVVVLERANAELRTELGQSHIKITEIEEHQNSLHSSYDQLNNEYNELHGVAGTSQLEKADAKKSYEAQVAKARAGFKKYHVQHRRRLRDLLFDLELVLGELGTKCLPYPEKGSTIGDIVRWFEGEVKSLPATFTRANKNFACFPILIGRF